MSTVIQLIYNALNLSGVSSLLFETPDSTQQSVGLDVLNGILAETKIDGSMIPYNSFQTFNTVAGQKEYLVDGLIQLESLAFVMDGTVRFSIRRDSTTDFYVVPRVENVQSLPSEYYVKRRKGGSNLLFYFVPDRAYEMQMYGKFSPTSVTINQELDDSFDDFYQKWLMYECASELSQRYNIILPANTEKKWKQLKSEIFQMEGIDLTVYKMPLSDRKQSPDFWWNANFGHNWVP